MASPSISVGVGRYTPLCGMYGNLPLDRLWFFTHIFSCLGLGPSVLERVYNFIRRVCPQRHPCIQTLIKYPLPQWGGGWGGTLLKLRRVSYTHPRSHRSTSFPGLFRFELSGREKTLASAGHVPILHPKILGVIN